jgi:hypothetical protein
MRRVCRRPGRALRGLGLVPRVAAAALDLALGPNSCALHDIALMPPTTPRFAAQGRERPLNCVLVRILLEGRPLEIITKI